MNQGRVLSLGLVLGLIVVMIFPVRLMAYIPGARMILSRTGEKALKKPLYIQQELQIGAGTSTVFLKEHWLFESDNTIRLLVEGEKELKDQIVFQSVYGERDRTSTISGRSVTERLPHPLGEKILFLSSADQLFRFLSQLGLLSEESSQSSVFKKIGSNFNYTPEGFIRLGRLGGSISYILGAPPRGESTVAGLWIEQDQFEIQKLKLGSGDEIRFEKDAKFAKGARWPKEISYTWTSNRIPKMAQAQILTAEIAESAQRSLFKMMSDRRTSVYTSHPGAIFVEDFYSRFR